MSNWPLIDLIEARAARDVAIGLVSDHSEPWMERALRMLPRVIPLGIPFTSEQIRLQLTEAGLEPPHHHNAWGALTMNAVRRGMLADTGQQGQMHTPKSHARRTPIWVRR